MFYIINKTIKYSPSNRVLSLLEEEENSVVLSNQGSRLLMELIKNSNSCLSREYMLKHVWEDFGLTPSNNNLYAAVSEIRKAFSALGMTEKVITTIPKTGFEFNCSIETFENSTPAIQKKLSQTKENRQATL
ncbi:transcriptional regulator [Serratia sp. NPDC078593]|uniref:winged helix-turn-helix domain-containing protein n=1 Tax=unclassified Serratia (in: enterobacteria) TaxID=2647522 RepID=UPI0037D4ECB6